MAVNKFIEEERAKAEEQRKKLEVATCHVHSLCVLLHATALHFLMSVRQCLHDPLQCVWNIPNG